MATGWETAQQSVSDERQQALAALAWQRAEEALVYGELTLSNRDGSARVLTLDTASVLRHVQWLASRSEGGRKRGVPAGVLSATAAVKRTDGRRPGHAGGGNSP